MQPESQTASTLPSIGEAWRLMHERVQAWVEGLIASLPNLLVALVVLLLFFVLSRLVRRSLESLMGRTRVHIPLRHLLANVASFAVIATGAFFALSIIGLDKTVTSLLAGVGIIGLALGFAFQEIASNFIAGVILSTRRPFRIGDLVEIDGHMGLVHDLNLRTTIVTLLTGPSVRIPNKDVIGNAIINYTVNGRRRVDMTVGVTYGEDLDQVRDVTLAALGGLTLRSDSRDPEVYFTEFGESSINMTARFWVDKTEQRDWLAARSEAVIAIRKAYAANGITIPFPIRTLDFATVGGRTLTEALDQSLVSAAVAERKIEA